MKNNQSTSLKLFNSPLQLQPSNLLSIILFFTLGFSFAILLTNVSLNFPFKNSFLSSTTTATATATSSSPPSPSPSAVERDMGFEDFIHPSKTMHDMSDQELIWRASMVPKVGKYPYNRIPKVAFMFLTRESVLMSPLWEKFFKGPYHCLFSIYVHISDLSSAWTPPEHSVFHGRKIPSKSVKWGKVTLIEAERRLLANALLDFSNQRFVLLSESCIPLFNFSTIYSYLVNSNQSFVQSFDEMGPVGRRRYNWRMYPTIKLQEWRKGSQWFEMNRDLALEVISDTTYILVFKNYRNRTTFPDEHYLPTFVTKKFGVRNSGRTLTFTDWSKGGLHPAHYMRNDVTTQFLETLRSPSHCEYNGRKNQICYLFARKFTPHALDRLLRFAPRVMHFNP